MLRRYSRLAAPEALVDRLDRKSGGVDMSFWVWVGVAVVVVLVVAFMSDRRRRGGWFQVYSDADGRNRTDRRRADGDRTTGEGYGGPGI